MLSILIVTYNCREDVERCLASISENPPTMQYEILLLDNGSKDGTVEAVESQYPSVRVMDWAENRGLAPALKHLVEQSTGDWLFFLDSDTVIQPTSFDPILKFFGENKRIGAVAPRLRDLTGEIQMTARNFPQPVNALFGRQTLISRLWPGNPVTQRFLKVSDQDRNSPFTCDWVAFAAVLVRRQAVLDAGSIDDDYFVYWVDADFFKRLGRAGWQVWCCPHAEILHAEQNKPNRIRSPLAIKDFNKGALRYFYKHHGWGGLNPLLWFAAVALWIRTQLQLTINAYRKLKADRA